MADKASGGKGADVQVTADWTRPKPLDVQGADSSKAYRWVKKDNLEQREREGWHVSRGDEKHKNPDRPSDKSEAKEYREMILCEMPREKAEAKNRYAQERAKQSLDSAERLYYQQARRNGIRTDV